MSLQVWLPLTGDLHNQGLSNYNISMLRGSAIFDDNGKIGKCFYANGVNTIKIENIISDFYNYPGYSLCAWFYIEAQNTTHSGSGIISAGNWNNQILNLALSGWSTDHYTQLQVSGVSWNKIYNYTFDKNTWYHVVVSSDGNKTYAYVNGTLIGDTLPGFLPTIIEGNNIAIGGATYYGGMQFFGKINDVRIYNHCLSNKEIKEIAKGLMLHYKLDNVIENNVYDCSGYSNNGTVTGSLTNENNTAQYSYSTYISNGTSSRITTPVLYFNKKNITLNIWFKSSNTSPAGNYHMIIDSVANRQWYEVAINNTGYFRGGLFVNGTRYVDNCSTKTGLNGAWHMLTLTYDGSIIKRYFDGVMEKSTTVSMTSGLSSPTALVIGRDGPSSTYACKETSLSDFRIYATALSQEDILDLYHTPASIDNKGNSYAREVIEDTSLNITKTGQFHGNEMLDDDTFTTASITKDDKQLKVNTLYEY